MSTRVLILGGTGIISSAAVARSVDLGHEVTVLHRGSSGPGARPLPEAVERLHGDLRDPASLDAALGDREFDVVADFMAFTPEHVAADIERWRGRTGQYVFISSASAYAKPPARMPVTESTPLVNPFWQYSRDKIACEDLLVAAHRADGFPATIIRPSHTYDERSVPVLGEWATLARMRAGLPVVVHGDGTSLWTLTHTRDVAVGLAGLFGNPLAIGEAFTITGDHCPTWNQIFTWIAQAMGVDANLVHVASETIARVLPDDGDGLLGDKAHSMIFDCAKVKALVPEFATTVPYWQGAAEQVAWFDAHPELQVRDTAFDAASERLIEIARMG